MVCFGPVGARAAVPHVVTRSTISGPAGLSGVCGARAGANNPLVAVDPSNPRRLVATYLLGSNGAGVGAVVALSRDAGRTWRRAALEGLTQCEGGRADVLSDPYLAYGRDEHVYIDASGIGERSNPNLDFRCVYSTLLRGGRGQAGGKLKLSSRPSHHGMVVVRLW